jgi:hypothetical protein
LKRKLLLINVALAALTALAGTHARQKWLEARKREEVVLRVKPKPLPPPPFSPLAAVEPVSAADYSEVAQQMLFSPDRNSTVVLEVAPPKPMPALPVVHGVVDIGEGPTAIMSAKSGGAHRGVHVGERVGEFKLVRLSGDEIVLEWDGHEVRKKVEELIDRSAPPAPEQSGAAAQAARPAASAAAVASPQQAGPGVDVGDQKRSCQPGDNTPAGAVQNGFRKVEIDSPFGKRCWWEPAK